jgi:hypothetical protein
MIRRLFSLAVVTAVGMLTLTATGSEASTPRFATPTTSTTTSTTPAVIVTPTTTTTTTMPLEIVTSTTTTTTTWEPALAAATTTATTSPQLASPTTTTEPDDDVTIGGIDPSGAVPDGLDLSAVPGDPAAPTAGDGHGPQFSAGMTCLNQCIKSGVAYPRGFGALLVVETHIPAEVFLSVLDADNESVGFTTSDDMVSEFSFALDHLEPGAEYFVVAAATDEHDDTAYAYGEFVTLSERSITVHVGSPVIFGGPTNITSTSVDLKVADLGWRSVDPPEELVYYSLPRFLDLGVYVERHWAHSQYTFCEGFTHGDDPHYGDSDSSCSTWNTAWLAEVDTDTFPAGQSWWTVVEIARALETGDGVPPEGAGPRYFDFALWITLSVEYS